MTESTYKNIKSPEVLKATTYFRYKHSYLLSEKLVWAFVIPGGTNHPLWLIVWKYLYVFHCQNRFCSTSSIKPSDFIWVPCAVQIPGSKLYKFWNPDVKQLMSQTYTVLTMVTILKHQMFKCRNCTFLCNLGSDTS